MSRSWASRPLGEVIAITKGRKPPRLVADSSRNAMPYATTSLFRSGTATQFVPSEDLPSCVVTPIGCPVLIWDGSNAGEVFVGKDAVLASTMALIKPDESVVDPGFCYLFLKTAFDELNGGTTGSTIPHVSKLTLTALQMPALPLDEQRLISGLLFKMEEAIAIQVTFATTAQELKRAAMRELFTRGLRGEAQKDTEIGLVPESWELASIGSHHSVVSGGTPSRGNPAYWTGGAIPWVKTTEVDYCVINETGEHITPLGLESSAAKMLPKGTLLMAMYGQGVTRGKVAILGIEAACNQACAAITPKDDTVLPRYLYHFLTSRYDKIRSLAHGGQQQNLNLEIVRDLSVAHPQTADEQHEIATILDALDRKIALHRQKRAVLEELFQSLLHKLMTGAIRVADLDLSALPPASATA
ncbi:MAG: restriction endonuclease subunit S [Thermomonas sp.]|nr:restriction endonuclease subunit S [Thermomonas sp.]MBZ0087911.1 restriction endonuclease subunit S [Thermomonas sp.]